MFAKSLTLGKTDIERAFDRGEFDIVLQPQIEVATGQPVAAEAFVRWNHPELGAMTPQLFLPLIETHGESPRLLDAVVRRSLHAATELIRAGRDWRISINLGVADLQTGVAPDVVAAALRASGLSPDSIMLEAPEAALTEGNGTVIHALERLKELGCGIALDSGGALPIEAAEHAPELFNEIKIGGAAIIRFAEIARKVDGGRIARRLAFARAHSLPAVAVGVESQQTLNALVKLGFTAVQGALVAKPQSLEALLAWDGGWSGEGTVPAAAPVVRMRTRPRLVTADYTPAPAPKLVEQLTPAARGFSFDDVDDDAMDVDFDDEAFGAPPSAVSAEAEAELDPSEDVNLDSEEMRAMENAAPLHAGMIDRPRLRRTQRFEEIEVEPIPEPAPAIAEVPAFDRPLALRMKAPPPRKGFLAKIGLGSLVRH